MPQIAERPTIQWLTEKSTIWKTMICKTLHRKLNNGTHNINISAVILHLCLHVRSDNLFCSITPMNGGNYSAFKLTVSD